MKNQTEVENLLVEVRNEMGAIQEEFDTISFSTIKADDIPEVEINPSLEYNYVIRTNNPFSRVYKKICRKMIQFQVKQLSDDQSKINIRLVAEINRMNRNIETLDAKVAEIEKFLKEKK